MPKKVHGRPAKARNRPRRAPAGVAAGAGSFEPNIVAETVPTSTPMAAAAANGVAAVPAAPAVARTNPAATRRASAAARKVAAATINYDYLRRDIRTLAVMAPVMIIVLIVAFIALH